MPTRLLSPLTPVARTVAVVALLGLSPVLAAPADSTFPEQGSSTPAAALISLREAQARALQRQPRLDALRAQTAAEHESAITAGELPDPRLKLGLSNVPTDSLSLNEDFMTQSVVAVEQTFPGGRKRVLRRETAEAAARQSEREFDQRVHEIRRDVALAWLDAHLAAQTVELLRAEEDVLQREEDAERIAYEANRTSQAAVLEARHALHGLHDRLLAAQGEAERARAELARWLGGAASPSTDLPLPSAPPPLATLEKALPEHPLVRALDEAVNAARSGLDLAREARRPDVSVELAYARRAAQFSDMVSAQVAFDLPVFPANRQDRDIAAGSLRLAQALSEREDRLRELRAALAAAYADWRAAQGRAALLREQTLPDVGQRAAAARIAYEAGQTPLAEILAIQREALETRLQLLEQTIATARARTRLEYFENPSSPETAGDSPSRSSP